MTQIAPTLPPDTRGRFRVLRPLTVALGSDSASVLATYPPAGSARIEPDSHFAFRSAWTRFKSLATTSDRQLGPRVLSFVRDYGLLGMDARGVPQWYMDEGVTHQEEVQWYRHYAKLATAIVDVARYAKKELARAPEGAVQALREHVEASYRNRILEVEVYASLALGSRRSQLWGSNTAGPDPEGFRKLQGEVAATVLNWWLSVGYVFPKVTFLPSEFRSGIGGGLWGAIGVAILGQVIEPHDGQWQCDICKRPVDINKRVRTPQAGRRVLCGREECRQKATRIRVADHRARRAKRAVAAGVVPSNTDRSMRQIKDSSGKTWDVEELFQGSGTSNVKPGEKLPPHTKATVSVISGAERFIASIGVRWQDLDDATLWSQLEGARRNR